jgi:hypothetical protein
MTRFLLFLVLSASPQRNPILKWSGRMTVGAEVFAIVGTATHSSPDAATFSFEVAAADGSTRSVSGVLRPAGGDLYVDGRASQISRETAASWLRQLRGRLEPPSPRGEYTCNTSEGRTICDSDRIVALEDFLSGRLRLVYNGLHLREIRFFSLPNWRNPFGEHVSLSLQIN